jgi:hypothetical protein
MEKTLEKAEVVQEENKMNENQNLDENQADSQGQADVPTDSQGKADKKEEAKPKIIRTTSLEKNHIPRNIRKIVKQKEKIRFDLSIQRNSVWSSQQKSLFIHSLIYGFPFPPAYAQDKGDGILWMLDGKQRLSCVIDFVLNEFRLHKSTPKCFNEAIGGKLFKELPEEFREEILSTNFTIYQMVDMTDEERDEMFVRLNRGTPLSKIEQTRAMYSDLISQIEDISKMEFFTNYVLLSKSAKNRFTDQELIIQTAMLLDNEHTFRGIGSVQIQSYVNELKEKNELISVDVFNKFVKADNYLSIVCNELSKAELSQIFKKVNIPMIIITAIKADENDVDKSLFGDFLVDFLVKNYSKDSEYSNACQSGSAKKENVVIRINAMDKAFTDFVNGRKDKGEEKLKSNLEQISNQVG